VKIKKPEDEKYFKDVVLNDILEEISNEDEITVENTAKRKKKKNTHKKRSVKYLVFMAIVILLTLFIITLFKLVTGATTEVKPTPNNTTPKADTQSWKMPEDRKDYKKTTPPKVLKEKKISKKVVKSTTIKIKPKKSKPLPPPPAKKTERELAKEALRQQMLN
jgi:cytoskeletal protein RodZ